MPNAAEPSPSEFQTHAMPILSLQVNDLDAAHRHLTRRKVPILEYHEEQSLIAADPDGLLIEVPPRLQREYAVRDSERGDHRPGGSPIWAGMKSKR
jgi:hypothetical protein